MTRTTAPRFNLYWFSSPQTFYPLAGKLVPWCAALAVIKVLGRLPARRRVRSLFAPRVSRTSLRRLLSTSAGTSVAGSERRVTVLCARIDGIRTAAGSGDSPRDAASIAAILNAHHAAMGRIIVGLDGTIGRAEGDAIEAYFGAPLEAADDQRRACLCAVRMQSAGKVLAARIPTDQLAALGAIAREVPVLAILRRPAAELEARARRLADALAARVPGLEGRVTASRGEGGGGSLPLQTLPGWVVEVAQAGRSAQELERRARAADPPVIGTVRAGRWRLDPRTLADAELEEVAAVLAGALAPA